MTSRRTSRPVFTVLQQLSLAALAPLAFTGCITKEAAPARPHDVSSRATYPLSDIEFEHNLLRVNSRQALVDHVEVLIDAHPELVFGYRHMASSEDKAIARIANYRLAQVHLELGCALHDLREGLTPSQNRRLGPPGFSHINRAFEIILRFEPATEDAELAPLIEPWYDVIRRRDYKVVLRSDDFCATVWIAASKPPRPPRPIASVHEGGSSIDPWLDHGDVCKHLEPQYLGALEPFVY